VRWTSLLAAGRSIPLLQNPRENPGPGGLEFGARREKMVRGLIGVGRMLDQITEASALTATRDLPPLWCTAGDDWIILDQPSI